MRKLIRKLCIVISVSLFILINVGIVYGAYIYNLIDYMDSRTELMNIFYEKRDTFDDITGYLNSIDGDVSFDDKEFQVSLSDEMSKKVRILLDKNGFDTIIKCEDNQSEGDKYVYFYKDCGFQWYQVIIYSRRDKEPPMKRTREFEKIENNWYYYYGVKKSDMLKVRVD